MPEHSGTGLAVAIPEAEPVVGALRRRLDATAAAGAPAHVTVLFPFVPAADVDDGLLTTLAGLLAGVRRFGYRFSRTGWFDDSVLWLAPDDPAPFRALTQRVWTAFPAYPPFGGAFDDVVPHLTVGHGHPREVLAAAEQAVLPRLPVTGTAGEVVLLAQHEPGGRWYRRAAFALDGAVSRR